jgi:glucose-6-phosphate isomerase
MITLNTKQLSAIRTDHGINTNDIMKKQSVLKEYITNIHKKNQGFYTVIDDKKILKDIAAYTKTTQGKYTDIVVLGIGGSALGTICLRDALTPLFKNKKDTTPTLHVIDNIDPVMIGELCATIQLKKTLFIVVTKSGGTPETLAQYFYIASLYKKAKIDTKKHMVFITDPHKGLLRRIGNEQGITMFDVPETVGGRFSVQTAVGLVPAALIGINIKELIRGCQDMRDQFLNTNIEKNLPFQIATIQSLLYEKGKIINVMMPYAQKLARFADWYRQLLAESIGKAKNISGETVNVGITPVNALGATDQHSQSQLYNEGPNDKLFMFLQVHTLGKTIRIPNPYPKDESVNFLKDTSFNELISVAKEATAASYTDNDRPNVTIEIDRIDAYHLGQLFMLFEGATAFLGEYVNINAFDQPGVELAKIKTKELLLKKHTVC